MKLFKCAFLPTFGYIVVVSFLGMLPFSCTTALGSSCWQVIFAVHPINSNLTWSCSWTLSLKKDYIFFYFDLRCTFSKYGKSYLLTFSTFPPSGYHVVFKNLLIISTIKVNNQGFWIRCSKTFNIFFLLSKGVLSLYF